MDIAVEQHSARSGTPFIIGVTGHRDLHPDDLAQLRGAVTQFVRLIRADFPDSELQFAIGMAEGADLLVAQTVLELGMRVNAILPMPLADYAADFDGENFATLQALLKHPGVECDELATVPASAASRAAESRASMYVNLSETLTRRTTLLLALWDGRASPLPGGTADTILRYLGARTDRDGGGDSRLEFVDASIEGEGSTSWAYWIPARRRDDQPDPGPTGPCFLSGFGDNVLQRHTATPALLQHQLHELADYNREFARMVSNAELGPLDSLLAGLPAGLPADLPLRDRVVLNNIDVEYGKADALAVYFQRRSDRLFKYFSIATFAMAAAYLSYERIAETSLLLFFYLLVLFSGVGVYLLLHGKHWFSRHLMYRVIAETMRAKFFLRLSGADHLVRARDVLALSGIDRFHGFGLINCVLKSVAPLMPRRHVSAPFESAYVEQMWIQSQERYFTSKVDRLEKNSARIARLKKVLFVLILAVIVALIAWGDSMHHTMVGYGVNLKNLLTFSMGIVAVWFGVWELHQNKMATRELLWQFRNQLNHFTRARVQLARSPSATRRREILAELGKDSLMESYLWTIHRYHREHEPPTST
jgi:hypothetical protein